MPDNQNENTETHVRPKRRYETRSSVHLPGPDFSRPLFHFDPESYERIFNRLKFLYGEETAEHYMPELIRVCQVYYAHKQPEMIEREKSFDPIDRFTQEDIILITYGDLLQGDDPSPLTTLSKFCGRYLYHTINTLHILPFFPYSSDRGFSVIDFESVDPRLGTWEHIEDLEGRYQLMFDGVINHVSSKSRWFQEFLNGNRYYRNFFISYDSRDALTPEQRSAIFRPRTSDILTEYRTIQGDKYVWTTFSDDQIDLNYHSPNVLMRVLEILLLYVRRGADIIRLDAITYLWAEPGTPCVHLEQTHEVVKLYRDVLNAVAPSTALITETNVPHEENISYFGNGSDEAQMVYNFALPPLVLHTFHTQDSTALSQWAAKLEPFSDTTTFFNFLDSHDGVGLMAVKNILTQEEINHIVERAQAHGGLVSYKTTGDNSLEPYEINITWYSALNREEDSLGLQIRRFVASRAVALVLQGVPGIYLPSLVGSLNDLDAVKATHTNRAINRTVLDARIIEDAMRDPLSKISLINHIFGQLTLTRIKDRAFHPNGPQKVLHVSPHVFAVLRTSPEGDSCVLCLINIANMDVRVEVRLDEIGSARKTWHDRINETDFTAVDGKLAIDMQAYDVFWLKPPEPCL